VYVAGSRETTPRQHEATAAAAGRRPRWCVKQAAMLCETGRDGDGVKQATMVRA